MQKETIRVPSEAVPVLQVLPGPPSRHGDFRHTLGSNAIVELDHQIATRDTVSTIEQEWDLERARKGSKQLERQRLVNDYF